MVRFSLLGIVLQFVLVKLNLILKDQLSETYDFWFHLYGEIWRQLLSIHRGWRASVLPLRVAAPSLKARTAHLGGRRVSGAAVSHPHCHCVPSVQRGDTGENHKFYLPEMLLSEWCGSWWSVFIQQTCILCPLYEQQYIKTCRLFRNGLRMDLPRR